MKETIYNTKGKDVGSVELPEAVFGAKKNSVLVHQVVTALRANARTVVAHAKGRNEVRGGGKKPWAQKGTGRARHGSIRSPIWRGGGKAHGPSKDRNFELKTTKSMRAKALATVLSEKYRSGRVMFVESLDITSPKTAEARTILTGLGKAPKFEEVATRRNNAALIVVPKLTLAVKKSFQNMGNVMLEEVRNLNPVEALTYRYLIVVDPEASISTLSARVA